MDELLKVCTVLYGIWLGRNNKVWENKTTPGSIVTESCFRWVNEWREARSQVKDNRSQTQLAVDGNSRKWNPPDHGMLKINVDASWFEGADTCSVGMVLRDHEGNFIEGRNMTLPQTSTVFEAESIGVKEALSWVSSRGERKVIVETDSKLTADAINGHRECLLEVGHVIDHCKIILLDLPEVTVKHVRKQANKVAHGIARLPCVINCCNVFTSPPDHLVEACLFDASF